MHPGRELPPVLVDTLEDGGIHDTEDRSVLLDDFGALLRWYRETAPVPEGSSSCVTGGLKSARMRRVGRLAGSRLSVTSDSPRRGRGEGAHAR